MLSLILNLLSGSGGFTNEISLDGDWGKMTSVNWEAVDNTNWEDWDATADT